MTLSCWFYPLSHIRRSPSIYLYISISISIYHLLSMDLCASLLEHIRWTRNDGLVFEPCGLDVRQGDGFAFE